MKSRMEWNDRFHWLDGGNPCVYIQAQGAWEGTRGVETLNELIDGVGVDPTIYVQGRGTQAPFGGGIGTCTGETHPYSV
jgi:hypothetical protein